MFAVPHDDGKLSPTDVGRVKISTTTGPYTMPLVLNHIVSSLLRLCLVVIIVNTEERFALIPSTAIVVQSIFIAKQTDAHSATQLYCLSSSTANVRIESQSPSHGFDDRWGEQPWRVGVVVEKRATSRGGKSNAALFIGSHLPQEVSYRWNVCFVLFY